MIITSSPNKPNLSCRKCCFLKLIRQLGLRELSSAFPRIVTGYSYGKKFSYVRGLPANKLPSSLFSAPILISYWWLVAASTDVCISSILTLLLQITRFNNLPKRQNLLLHAYMLAYYYYYFSWYFWWIFLMNFFALFTKNLRFKPKSASFCFFGYKTFVVFYLNKSKHYKQTTKP